MKLEGETSNIPKHLYCENHSWYCSHLEENVGKRLGVLQWHVKTLHISICAHAAYST